MFHFCPFHNMKFILPNVPILAKMPNNAEFRYQKTFGDVAPLCIMFYILASNLVRSSYLDQSIINHFSRWKLKKYFIEGNYLTDATVEYAVNTSQHLNNFIGHFEEQLIRQIYWFYYSNCMKRLEAIIGA